MTTRIMMSATIRTSGEITQSRHRHTGRSGGVGAGAGAGDSSDSSDGDDVEFDRRRRLESFLWRASICVKSLVFAS